MRSTVCRGSCDSKGTKRVQHCCHLTEPAHHPYLFNWQAVPHLFVDMAEALGAGSDLPAERAVPAVLGAIRQLSSDVGIPRNLKELVRPGRNRQSCLCFVTRLTLRGLCAQARCAAASAHKAVLDCAAHPMLHPTSPSIRLSCHCCRA